MTGYLIAAVTILAGSTFFLARGWIESSKEKNEEIRIEKEKVVLYKKILKDNAELQEKADELEKGIEEKNNARKKMSKAEKIAAANSRTSGV